MKENETLAMILTDMYCTVYWCIKYTHNTQNTSPYKF